MNHPLYPENTATPSSVQLMSWPGLMRKKLNKKPSDDQIEVAIPRMKK